MSATVFIEPALMDKAAAGAFLGKPHVLRLCREAGWIVPVEQRGGLTLYSVAHLRALAAKIEREGLPSPKRQDGS